MMIVSGWIVVDPEARPAYLEGSAEMAKAGRKAPGCLDLAITAGLADDSRVNIFERWPSELGLMAFRHSGPEFSQFDAVKEMNVCRYEASPEGPA
ncbi:MAG: antibiotic biosynthesis monooxygenase family protein [Aeromicrobium sp.]